MQSVTAHALQEWNANDPEFEPLALVVPSEVQSVIDYALQVWNADDPEDEPLALVVRTGLNSTMGSMVRQLISPTCLQLQAEPFIPVRSMQPMLLASLHLEAGPCRMRLGFCVRWLP